MRLSDVMSYLHLSVYPQIALVIFLGVFALVLLRVLTMSRRELDAAARLPIEDEKRSL